MSCHPDIDVQAGSLSSCLGKLKSRCVRETCSLQSQQLSVCWPGHSSTVSPGGHSSVGVSREERSWLCPSRSPSRCPGTMLPYYTAGLKHGVSAWLGSTAHRFRPLRVGMGQDGQKEHRAEPNKAHIVSPCGSAWDDPSQPHSAD